MVEINSISDLKTDTANNQTPQVENQAVQENAAKSGQRITQQTMGQILAQLGMLDTAENQQLAKALLEYNFPLNKETLKELSRLLKQLGDQSKEDANLLAFLKSKNIPLGKELVQIIKQFLKENNLANLLNKYLPMEKNQLDKIISQLKEGTNSGQAGKEKIEQILKTLQQLPKESLDRLPKEVLEKLPDQIKELLKPSSLSEKEKPILNKLMQQLKEETNSGQVSKEKIEQILKTLQQLPKESLDRLPKEVLEKLPDQIKELLKPSSLPQAQLQQLVKTILEMPPEILKKLQNEWQKLLENSQLPENEQVILTKLFQQLKNRGQNPEQLSQSLAKTLQELPIKTMEKLQSQLEELVKQNQLPVKEKLIFNRLIQQLTELVNKQKPLTENPKEAKDLSKLLKNLVVNGESLDPQDLMLDLKKVIESKKEILQGKHPLLKEQAIGGDKEGLTKLLSDIKGNLETENLLKYCQIPILIQEKLYQAQLKINQDDQNRSKNQQEGDQLVIFLQTKNLGLIKIDLTAQEKNLAFDFGVEEEAIKVGLETNLPQLTERLEALGYQIKAANCSLSQEGPEEVYLEMEKKVIISGFKKIDLLT